MLVPLQEKIGPALKNVKLFGSALEDSSCTAIAS
jgi:hypothetical protein